MSVRYVEAASWSSPAPRPLRRVVMTFPLREKRGACFIPDLCFAHSLYCSSLLELTLGLDFNQNSGPVANLDLLTCCFSPVCSHGGGRVFACVCNTFHIIIIIDIYLCLICSVLVGMFWAWTASSDEVVYFGCADTQQCRCDYTRVTASTVPV